MLRWTVYLKGPKKSLHAAVALGHEVYCFGGFCLGETYDNNNVDEMDVLVFNTVSLRWAALPPTTSETGGECPPAEAVPSMRVCHTAVLIEDLIYIWGGVEDFEIKETGNGVIDIGGIKSNALYAFHVDTHGWSRPEVSQTVPEARCGHSACVLGKAMYVFGGFNMLNGYSNDIHKLDTATMSWSLIHTGGTSTPVSECHTATFIGPRMFVFGGRGTDEDASSYGRVRVFDTETDRWLSTPSPPPQLVPEGRWGHSAFVYHREMFIFGGNNFPQESSVTFNDVWKFNPQTFSWTRVEPRGKRPSRMSWMSCCTVGDCVVLFGGFTPEDLYILDLSPSLKTLCKLAVIQYGLEPSGLTCYWRMPTATEETPHDCGRDGVPGGGIQLSC